MAKKLGATVQTVDKHTLNQLSGNRPHQVTSTEPCTGPFGGVLVGDSCGVTHAPVELSSHVPGMAHIRSVA